MAITEANINIGTLPNDGSGDPLRVAFDKINNNFAELMQLAPHGPNGSLQFAANGLYNGTANIQYDVANNILNLGANVLPLTDATISLGASTDRFKNLYLANNGFHTGNLTLVENNNLVTFAVPGKQADIGVGNVYATGNLVLQGDLVLGNLALNTSVISTTDNSANQILYQAPTTGFNSAEFMITSRETGTNNNQKVTLAVTLTNDKSGANYSAYGTLFHGIPVTRYNVDVAFGNIRIMVNPLRNSTSTHTIEYVIVN